MWEWKRRAGTHIEQVHASPDTENIPVSIHVDLKRRLVWTHTKRIISALFLDKEVHPE
jgi:hypothetical protein